VSNKRTIEVFKNHRLLKVDHSQPETDLLHTELQAFVDNVQKNAILLPSTSAQTALQSLKLTLDIQQYRS
jgi:hypothetical protein